MKKIWFYCLPVILLLGCGENNNSTDNGGETKINWNAVADSSSSAFAATFWNTGRQYS